MAFFEDLSPYSYPARWEVKENVLSIGWLDKSQPFVQGPVDEAILKKLFELSKKPTHQTRGFYMCNLCKEQRTKNFYEILYNNETYYLGLAEIWIEGVNGITYAAPNLICHYIKEHQYLPPQKYLDAVKALI